MSATNVVLAVLVIAVVIQSGLLLLLFRQVGVLLLARVETVEEGPEVGSLLTEEMSRVVGFEPDSRTVGRNGEARTLLLLTRRGCSPCETTLRSLPRWMRDRETGPALLVSGDGMLDLDPTTKMRLRSSGVREHESLEALAVLGVGRTPFALLLDGSGRVLSKGVLSRQEHLDRLVSQVADADPDAGAVA